MSKPNLLAFSSSVGIYRNEKMQALAECLAKKITRKVPFSTLAPMLFQMAMAYAAENQLDGDFEKSKYPLDRWRKIFLWQDLEISTKEAAIILEGFETVGLFDRGKIRNWMKYNRHLADYEGLVRAKRKAAKIMHEKRQRDAKAALKNGEISHSETDSEPEKNVEKTDSASKQLWLLEKALESAKGKARKELLAKKRELLSGTLDVDLSEPAPQAPTPAPARPRKQDPGEFSRVALKNGRQLIADDSAELLTESMVRALLNAGDELPAEAQRKFPKLVAELGNRNPVPE
jgi:hypothetical protein